MTKRFGFTLAEVLITLGIIGVVAAMTIPTLISNTNGAQFKSAYKKALSSLNQAVLMNVAMEDTDFSTLKDDSASTGGNHVAGSLAAMLGERLQSATDVSGTYFVEVAENSGGAITPVNVEMEVTCTAEAIAAAQAAQTAGVTGDIACVSATAPTGDDEPEVDEGIVSFAPTQAGYYVFALADGTYFGFNKNAKNCSAKGTPDCIGFIDVNGSTNPNTIITCDSGTGAGSGQDGADTACEVSNTNIKDIYPVFFYGQTVEPASEAARTVLFGK